MGREGCANGSIWSFGILREKKMYNNRYFPVIVLFVLSNVILTMPYIFKSIETRQVYNAHKVKYSRYNLRQAVLHTSDLQRLEGLL